MFDQYKPISGDEREKLYKEIWEEPVSIVSKRFNISDTTLRKWCTRYCIPLPYSGYWARVRAGQKIGRPELPEIKGDVRRYVRNYNLKYRTDIDDLKYDELNQISGLSMLREETQVKIIEKCSNLKVPDKLKNPHKLIKEYQEELNYREKRNNTLSKIDKKSKRYETVKSQYREDKEIISINVTNENLDRVFCILDVIFKIVEEFEGFISTSYYRDNNSVIYLMNSIILFNLTERKSKLIFTIKAKSYFEESELDVMIFQDTEVLLMENQVGEIVNHLFVAANKLLAMDKLAKLEKQRHEENEKRKRMLEKARKGELEELKELLQLATDWENANKIRKFLSAAEEKVKDIVNDEEKERVNQWIQNNRNRVDWLDPLIKSDDEILGRSISVFEQIED